MWKFTEDCMRRGIWWDRVALWNGNLKALWKGNLEGSAGGPPETYWLREFNARSNVWNPGHQDCSINCHITT